MHRWSRWVGIGAAIGVISALVPVVRGSVDMRDPLGKLQRRIGSGPAESAPELSGLDMLRMDIRPRRVTLPMKNGHTAELTLDADVQRAALVQLKKYRVPEGGVVLEEVKTGRLLAYASYVNEGEKFDFNARAEAPAASVFKVVTGAALVEKGGLNPGTEQCYRGGKSRLMPDELEDDPRRDKWCATLGIAMGRSLNVVFGRLARKHLTPEDLTAMGGAFGFGSPVPFPAPNQAPAIEIPSDPLEFARSAAGFWHTTLSPLLAVTMAQTVANGGVTLEPRIVNAVYQGTEKVWEERRDPLVLRRAIKPETARALTTMMVETVANGSAYKSFHDTSGRSFLPGVEVAGKTGTLAKNKENRLYTWFVGFAPVEKPEVAVAALVVNTPTWHIKGPELARDVLRSYFAKKGMKGIVAP